MPVLLVAIGASALVVAVAGRSPAAEYPATPSTAIPLPTASLPERPPATAAIAAVLAEPITSAPRFEDLGPGGVSDPRFGVIVVGSGASAVSEDVEPILDALGATSWYAFDSTIGRAPGQAGLVRPGVDLDRLAQLAGAAPGSAWIIGNEPNVPGQDDMSPERYASFLHETASAILSADPSATVVGPNVLNWDVTCTACPGFTSARSWSTAFVAAYQAEYGQLPLTTWGMHTYSLDWLRLPLTDADADQQQLIGARSWLDARDLGLPIWLTEFGVIWGYDGIEWVPRPGSRLVAEPRGTFRFDLVEGYLDHMLGWLKRTGPTLRIERWFLYGTSPPPEPYAEASAGLTLVEPESTALTALGERYRAWSLGRLSGDRR